LVLKGKKKTEEGEDIKKKRSWEESGVLDAAQRCTMRRVQKGLERPVIRQIDEIR